MTNIRNEILNIQNSGIQLIGFGESQHGTHEIFFNNLSRFNSLFNGIFIELPADFQSSVDYYLKNSCFNLQFQNLLKGAETENKDMKRTYSLIFDYAVSNNIPVICIDSSKTKTGQYQTPSSHSYCFLKTDSRDGDMFSNINQTLKEFSGNWLLISHLAHLDYSFDLYQGNPSLGQRLKKAAVPIYTIGLFPNPHIQEVTFYPSKFLPPDLVLPIPNPPQESFDAIILHPLSLPA